MQTGRFDESDATPADDEHAEEYTEQDKDVPREAWQELANIIPRHAPDEEHHPTRRFEDLKQIDEVPYTTYVEAYQHCQQHHLNHPHGYYGRFSFEVCILGEVKHDLFYIAVLWPSVNRPRAVAVSAHVHLYSVQNRLQVAEREVSMTDERIRVLSWWYAYSVVPRSHFVLEEVKESPLRIRSRSRVAVLNVQSWTVT
ncbi:hypothetical protein E4U35_005554 [Claviceps purpurea]|nr:hypothetical protein E4U35_005554 [Claviceps purpurea]